MPAIAAHHVVTGVDTGQGRAHAQAATVHVEGDRIVSVTPGIDPDAEFVEGWLVPGFVDVHGHGAAGHSYSDPYPENVLTAVRYHRAHGTTSLFTSTVTEHLDDLVAQVAGLRRLVEAGEVDGIHLEGPFLSHAHKGAHDETLLIDPTPEAVGRLLAAGGEAIAMVTLAPELPGGMDAVKQFTKAGVAVAFGHTDGLGDEARTSIEAGVTTVTHLFNAMTGIHHRKPGPIPWLLTDERVSVELICDGIHLHADTVRMAIEAAGIDRVLVVTDAMAATGQADGRYVLGSLQVDVLDGVARIVVAGDAPGPIAGSTLTMDQAVTFLVDEVGVGIGEAAVMASTSPARWHHLDEVGELSPGRLANLCVLDDGAHLRRVMRRGRWLTAAGTTEGEQP
ncbi:N-acetylglucosamine-6-phosphate deacetylase [Aestuariimicrobium kwangyangense]|uniref:N-acetylglucosamine-6-phosphate deacetylase n=1 Tax=Aestuariimicrobium kwangyangense TaxID=396389 RepID=UPI0003B380A0|nr:N-acetylglucosamine-6-phosphate deacetylase [Aestuariimicrobium kwangyangense]